MDGEDEIRGIFCDSRLNYFIENSLTQSLSSIGYSAKLLDDLFDAIKNSTIGEYIERNAKELYQLHGIHFLNDLASRYFALYVVPEIPFEGKVLDLGCGTGTLLKELLKCSGTKIEVVGMDIDPYPEWDALRASGIRVEKVVEKDFISFIERELPDTVTLTWVLHHMDYAEQERYLKAIYGALKPGARIVVLEDSYSEKLPPEEGRFLYDDFMALSIEDRKKVMGVFDWVANRILEQREKVPMPFGYRTLEEWQALFESVGFTVVKTRFMGFPKNRDVNNGQSVLMAVR